MLMIGIRNFVSYQNLADMYTLKVLLSVDTYWKYLCICFSGRYRYQIIFQFQFKYIIHCNFRYNSVTYKQVIFIFNESCKT